MKQVYEHLLEMINTGARGVLVTVINVSGSVPRHPGSKMVVHENGKIFGSIGGGKVEKTVIDESLSLIGHEKPQKSTFNLTEDDGMLCGGTVEILYEPFGGQEKLFIFGAGHIGQELAPLAVRAGFTVTVVDNRPEFANRERFPLAIEIIADDYQAILPRLKFDERCFIVIVSHGHKFDADILHYCVHQPFAYLGMIGSKRKTQITLAQLEMKGIERAVLNRVNSPIGLNIGAETPFEIAISILAEMIASRSGAKVASLSMKSGI